MCSSSKKPLAECTQTSIAIKKGLIAKYREEDNGLKAHTGQLEFKSELWHECPLTQTCAGRLSLVTGRVIQLSAFPSHTSLSLFYLGF